MMEQPAKTILSTCYNWHERGAHIRNTAEIGPVAIGKIENKGRQNRRVILAFAE